MILLSTQQVWDLKADKTSISTLIMLKIGSIYIDTIYNPIETKTLKFLKNNKIKTFGGLDMLIYQGQKSFYLWHKINPEIDEELVQLLNSKLQ